MVQTQTQLFLNTDVQKVFKAMIMWGKPGLQLSWAQTHPGGVVSAAQVLPYIQLGWLFDWLVDPENND